MWTLISVSFALIINFFTPNIPEDVKVIKNKLTLTGFPYQYFPEKILTEKERNSRIRVIYIYFMMYITLSFSISPIVQQIGFILTTTPIEKLIPNQFQLTDNIGLDTRPSMQLTLRLRGPKNNNTV